jgi:hypothetical protein
VRLRFLIVFALTAAAIALAAAARGQPAGGRFANSTYGFSVRLPSGWQRAPSSMTPHLTDPREILSAATFPLRYRDVGCAHTPSGALEDLGPTDALVTVLERGRGGSRQGFPQRPVHFGPHEGVPSEASQCVSRPARFTDRVISFRDGRRRFYALIAFGPRVSLRTRGEAFTLLDSLRFDPARRPSWRDSG